MKDQELKSFLTGSLNGLRRDGSAKKGEVQMFRADDESYRAQRSWVAAPKAILPDPIIVIDSPITPDRIIIINCEMPQRTQSHAAFRLGETTAPLPLLNRTDRGIVLSEIDKGWDDL
jgi:hypothetical protein